MGVDAPDLVLLLAAGEITKNMPSKLGVSLPAMSRANCVGRWLVAPAGVQGPSSGRFRGRCLTNRRTRPRMRAVRRTPSTTDNS